MKELEVVAVGPAAKLALGVSKDGFESGQSSSFAVVGFHLGILGDDDGADEVFGIVGHAVVEHGEVDAGGLLCAVLVLILQFVIALDVFGWEAIFDSKHVDHRLKGAFFVSSFEYATSEGAYEFTVFEDDFISRKRFVHLFS